MRTSRYAYKRGSVNRSSSVRCFLTVQVILLLDIELPRNCHDYGDRLIMLGCALIRISGNLIDIRLALAIIISRSAVPSVLTVTCWQQYVADVGCPDVTQSEKRVGSPISHCICCQCTRECTFTNEKERERNREKCRVVQVKFLFHTCD